METETIEAEVNNGKLGIEWPEKIQSGSEEDEYGGAADQAAAA